MTEDEVVGGITSSMHMSLRNSGRWGRTGKPGVLQSMGSQRVRHDLVTKEQSRKQTKGVFF